MHPIRHYLHAQRQGRLLRMERRDMERGIDINAGYAIYFAVLIALLLTALGA